MKYADFFYKMKVKFDGTDVSDIKEHLAFQFDIEDEEAGGCFYVEVKEGKLYIEPYEYYDRDAEFICKPDVLVAIADGKLDPVEAYTKGNLRVEGNIGKALKFKDIVAKKLGGTTKGKGTEKKAKK